MARDMNVLPAMLDMRKEREQMRELWAQGKRCTICGAKHNPRTRQCGLPMPNGKSCISTSFTAA